VITAVGDDPFGAYVREALGRFGVDTRFVATHPTLRTPLAFASPVTPDEPELLFYREPSAPDEWIRPGAVDLGVARDVPILWVSASCFAFRETGAAARALLEARGRRRDTILDLDYRPTFWPDESTARRTIGAMVDHATIAVGNRAECEIAVGTDDPGAAADALLGRGARVAVVKLGGDGVLVATPEERALVPPVPVEVVCGLGAGDAFGGALCHGLLAGWAAEEAVHFANAAGAIVASRLLCADAMPTESEVRALLEEQRARA
jgi:5-dehydro-2-deoxygluconokinase